MLRDWNMLCVSWSVLVPLANELDLGRPARRGFLGLQFDPEHETALLGGEEAANWTAEPTGASTPHVGAEAASFR